MITSKEPEYIAVNRIAYDSLAGEYRERAGADRIRDEAIVAPFITYLKTRFGSGARILDIGFGNGVNLAMFHEHGFRLAGIDISPKMLSLAKEFCPMADLRLGDFLTSDYSSESFEGIFSKASIHLFPKEDALRAISKVSNMLVPDGMFYVTTTVAAQPSEGYSEKSDYRRAAVRYRKFWTREELIAAVTSSGLTVYAERYNDEPERDKQWFNLWATRSKQ